MRMSEEERMFWQDVKTKKNIARSAPKKKSGAKSKKCNFPSDYLTKKEKEALNGEVFSFNPNNWYTWKEVLAMPEEYQVKYINSLLTRYDCGLRAIAQVVFHCAAPNVIAHFKRIGQYEYLNCFGKHGGHHYDKGRQKLEEAFSAYKNGLSEEIQNGTEEDAVPEKTIDDLIAEADHKIEIQSLAGIAMKAEDIDNIYREKTGMGLKEISQYRSHEGHEEVLIEEEPIEEAPVEEAPVIEDTPDDFMASDFLIRANKLDSRIVDIVRDLFEGRKYEVTVSVVLKDS